MQTVLTIAGFDPSSGAGVTADLMVFAAHGLFGTACITSLTVQSTLGVFGSHPVAGEIVAATLGCLQNDLPPSGIKIGMLATAGNVAAVAAYLAALRTGGSAPIVVLDPVLTSTSGRELLDREGVELMRTTLLPLVNWITPNAAELGILAGNAVGGRESMAEACAALRAGTPGGGRLGIIATGGEMHPPDDYVLTPEGADAWLPGCRVETRATHGTGCAFSSALLSRLVLGDASVQAAAAAKEYVRSALEHAIPMGAGHGPMRHLWPLVARSG